MNITEGDDKAVPMDGWKLKDPFSVLALFVVLLPVPGQCDVGYPCTICETDCRALCFSNRCLGWTPLVA